LPEPPWLGLIVDILNGFVVFDVFKICILGINFLSLPKYKLLALEPWDKKVALPVIQSY